MRLADFDQRRRPHRRPRSDAKSPKSIKRTPQPRPSLLSRLFGERNLLDCVIGTFFAKTANTAGLFATVVAMAIAYTVVRNGEIPDELWGFIQVVGGFYFGRFNRPGSA